MDQLALPHIEEDIFASIIRRQKNLCDELIKEFQDESLTFDDAHRKIKEIEKGLRNLFHFH